MGPSDIEAARRRGEALVALGDISGARRFLERAALAGSGPAALAMAETFDPRVLAGRGVIGLSPDSTAALTWYRRALALGMAEAAPRIATLEAAR
jgi:TPR repeat protein